MDWLTELKDKAREHTISLTLTLVGLLLGVVWAAIPAEIWGRVSAAIPKRVLWSVIGLLVLGLILETAFVAHLRRKSKLKPRFGIYWDKDLTPYCPAHKDIALGASARQGTHGLKGLLCPKGHIAPLEDDHGKSLSLQQARHLLRTASDKLTDDYVIEEVREKILLGLVGQDSGMTADQLARSVESNVVRVTFILNEMEDNGYLYAYHPMFGPGDATYRLTKKSTAFLMGKGLI